MNKSTDETTTHLTKLANYANQVIGYARFDIPARSRPVGSRRRSRSFAGAAASFLSRTGCFATPSQVNPATIYGSIS